jgi:hypothetical protein
MISVFLTAVIGVLPAAIAALPALIAMPISAIMVKLALSALPYPEGPRETIDLAANKVLNFGLTGILVFFLALMAASNMAAYEAQGAFDAALSQRR